MTTRTTTTVIDHTNDAGFRAWGSEFCTKLNECGLVQTADTGQVNWVTVTRPGVSTAGGYEIRRFNDTLQGTKPVFIKFETGTGSVATTPQIWMTVGTGSDGAGNLTGLISSRVIVSLNTTLSSNVLTYESNFCYKDGHLGVEFKRGSTANTLKPFAYFTLTRTTDQTTGAWNGYGLHFVYMQAASAQNYVVSFNFTTSTINTAQAVTPMVYGFSYGQTSATLVGMTQQTFRHFHTLPLVYCSIGSCGFLVSESTPGGTTSLKLVGTTARTYLVTSMKYGAHDTTAVYHAFLWE